MLKNSNLYGVMIGLVSLILFSCSDSFLDQEPDERSVIDTSEKIRQLLIGSYPSANYGWLCEISSDNIMDNNAPHYPISASAEQISTRYNLSSYDRCDDELFRFEQGVSATGQDTPKYIWEDFYASIFSCNW